MVKLIDLRVVCWYQDMQRYSQMREGGGKVVQTNSDQELDEVDATKGTDPKKITSTASFDIILNLGQCETLL